MKNDHVCTAKECCNYDAEEKCCCHKFDPAKCYTRMYAEGKYHDVPLDVERLVRKMLGIQPKLDVIAKGAKLSESDNSRKLKRNSKPNI